MTHPNYRAIAAFLGELDIAFTFVDDGVDDPHLQVGESVWVYHPNYSDVKRWEICGSHSDYGTHRSAEEAAVAVANLVR